MVERVLYPKTKRFSDKDEIIITEKMDGSNLGFYKYNEVLFIAQRNQVFALHEIDTKEVRGALYKGLYDWLVKNGEELQERLVKNAVIFGEWIGMGRIQYPEEFNYNFFQFAKANMENWNEITNLKYDSDLFKYSFVNQEKPDFIRQVRTIRKMQSVSLESLDALYDETVEDEDRNVEGFILIYPHGNIEKYVRFKRGRLVPHTDGRG